MVHRAHILKTDMLKFKDDKYHGWRLLHWGHEPFEKNVHGLLRITASGYDMVNIIMEIDIMVIEKW